MANPQIEDGYTKIANELLEAILTVNLSNYAFRVFMAIMRKTYGFNKKTDYISLSQISDLTNIKTPHVCRAIRELTSKNMLIKNGKVKGINKNYKHWELPNQAVPNQAVPNEVILPNQVIKVTYSGNKKLPNQADTKEKKETYTKEIIYIVEYLNEKSEKSYKHTSRKTQDLIRARINEGFTLDDFKKVIDTKTSQWKSDPKMNAYLRPETLFGTKFESYLNEKIEYSGNDKETYSQAYKCFKDFGGGYCQTNFDAGDLKCNICKENKHKWRSKE